MKHILSHHSYSQSRCAFSLRRNSKSSPRCPITPPLAREIGDDKVDVTTLAKPTEDPHFVDARPSFVVQACAPPTC